MKVADSSSIYEGDLYFEGALCKEISVPNVRELQQSYDHLNIDIAELTAFSAVSA